MSSLYDISANGLEPVIEGLKTWYDKAIEAAAAMTKGKPYGLDALPNDMFLRWFYGKMAADPNWVPALLLDNTSGGKELMEKYDRLRFGEGERIAGMPGIRLAKLKGEVM